MSLFSAIYALEIPSQQQQLECAHIKCMNKLKMRCWKKLRVRKRGEEKFLPARALSLCLKRSFRLWQRRRREGGKNKKGLPLRAFNAWNERRKEAQRCVRDYADVSAGSRLAEIGSNYSPSARVHQLRKWRREFRDAHTPFLLAFLEEVNSGDKWFKGGSRTIAKVMCSAFSGGCPAAHFCFNLGLINFPFTFTQP